MGLNRYKMKKFKMILEKTDTGFSAYSPEYPVFTTGESINEVINNTVEAFNLFLEEKFETARAEQIELELDFQQFFQYYNVINSKVLAEKLE